MFVAYLVVLSVVLIPLTVRTDTGHRNSEIYQAMQTGCYMAIDYFFKWVEVTSYAHITQNTFLKFLKNNVICRYGLPNKIVTDNAKNLNGPRIQSLCDQYKIQHLNSLPYRP